MAAGTADPETIVQRELIDDFHQFVIRL